MGMDKYFITKQKRIPIYSLFYSKLSLGSFKLKIGKTKM